MSEYLLHSISWLFRSLIPKSRMPALSKSGSGAIKIILFRWTFLTFVLSLVFLGMVGSPLRQEVFGDGLTAENLPPATVGDR